LSSTQSTPVELKKASTNIVNTLLASGATVSISAQKRRASSMDENDEKVLKAKRQAKFFEKYLKGDLGEEMSADLNYTLKRLIDGVISDDHSVKKGFFVALVSVFARFKSQISVTKLLTHLSEETKTSSMMKNPEVNSMILGRLMVISALVESQAYQSSASQL
jgi:hypothetical protein